MDILEFVRSQRIDGSNGQLVESLCREIERLRGYFEFDANCPCCQQTYQCEVGCTFAEDAPEDHEKMIEARNALTQSIEVVVPTEKGC